MSEPSNELFAPEPPVRSDFARRGGTPYAVRRLITLAVLAAVLGGGGYWLWDKVFHSAPGEIPTIRAEGSYKERPDRPGGIDIPHQDVQVYREIDGSAGTDGKPVAEHLLPPPEAPSAPPPVASNAEPKTPSIENLAPQAPIQTTVSAAPAVSVSPPTPTLPPSGEGVTAAPSATVSHENNSESPSPVGGGSTAASKPSSAVSKDGVIVQLAASPDRHAAEGMAHKLQVKYKSVLGGAHLHPVRADLGAKGVFYRIQSQPLPEPEAKSICASLKKNNAGCLLVRP